MSKKIKLAVLQINLTIRGTNTVLRTWKKDVTLSMTEMQDLVAILKLAFPSIRLYGIEVTNKFMCEPLPEEFLINRDKTFELFGNKVPDHPMCRCATLSLPSWDDFKKRLEEAKTVKEFLYDPIK